MKISELENILKIHKRNRGDIEVSFGFIDKELNEYEDCEVDIRIDTSLEDIKLNIIIV